MSTDAEDKRLEGFLVKLSQQRLKAWQPVLSPKWTISCYLIVGAAFLGLGIQLLNLSRSVSEYTVDYTERMRPGERVGHFEIPIQSEMQPPIWLYYELSGFHQNHRRYVQSRADAQLRMGKSDTPVTTAAELSSCHPWITTGSRVNYPCGLVARSVFNDSFRVSYKPADSDASNYSSLEVDQKARTIAWAADVDSKYKNIDPEAVNPHTDQQNQVDLNMWILNKFPPEECEQIDVTLNNGTSTWRPVRVRSRQVLDKDGATVTTADCRGYSIGKPSCNFETTDGKPFECTGAYRRKPVSDWGIQSGHFMVWMRIAGLPRFRKLWGKIDRKLEAGSSLLVSFTDEFPVATFQGRKAFVLSTSSILGGRNDFLGWGYMAVGSVCLLFGLVYLFRHMAKPRVQGDIRSMSWHAHAT